MSSISKSLSIDLWQSSTKEKISRCKGNLQLSNYEAFEKAVIEPTEKRRLLKDHLLTAEAMKCAEIYKHLPALLPNRWMRSSLFIDLRLQVPHAVIPQLQLTVEATFSLILELIKRGDCETNRGIIHSRTWSVCSKKEIQTLFKTVAIVDKTAQLLALVFQTMASESFPRKLQYRCARSCFKAYGPDHGLQAIKGVQMNPEMLVAYPQIGNFDPEILRQKGYSMELLQQIFQLWIEKADERSLFMAKGRRAAWGVTLESMNAMIGKAHKLLPRQLCKRVYKSLTPKNLKVLEEERGFKKDFWIGSDAHLNLCHTVLKNLDMLGVTSLRKMLLPLMCRTAEYDQSFRQLFMLLLQQLNPPLYAPFELYQMISTHLKELCTEYPDAYFLSLLNHFKGTPLFFALIRQQAKIPDCHLFIFQHLEKLGLNEKERHEIALLIIKHGLKSHVKALLEVLSSFELTPEVNVQIIFKCLTRFLVLGIQPLLHLNTYNLPADMRQDFLYRWNEQFLGIFINPLMGKYFDRLALSEQELHGLFRDALSRLPSSKFKADSSLFQRMREKNYDVQVSWDVS